MRGRRAYIASAGTAAVMLCVSLGMFVLVSAFVAFGAWPGAKSADRVNQVVLADVTKAKPKLVAVRSDAVVIARRAAARRALRLATARIHSTTQQPNGNTVAQLPAGTTPATTGAPATGATQTVAQAPQQTTQKVAGNLNDTTNKVTTQVQQQAQNVQTQVNQVVDQVVGGGQPTSTNPVGGTVNTVTNTVTSVLGH